MAKVDELRSVLLRCSIVEIKAINQLVSSDEKRGSTSKTKLSKLLEFVYNRDLNQKEIYNELYPNGTPQAFKKILSRLEDLVLDYISQFKQIEEYPKYDFKNREILLIVKRLITSDILWLRGFNYLSLKRLDSLVTDLIKLEQFELLISVLIRKRRIISFRANELEYNKIQQQLKHYITCNEYEYEARVEMEKLNTSPYEEGTLKEDLNQKQLLIKRLEYLFGFTGSMNIRMSLFYVRNTYLLDLGRLIEAEKYLQEILNDLLNSKWIYSMNNHVSLLVNLAYIKFRGFAFVQGRRIINESSEITATQTNKFIGDLFIAQSYFYEWNKPRLNLTLSKIDKSYESYPIPANWRIKEVVLRAATTFVERNCKEAVSILNGYDYKEEEREGWHFSLKLLRIMCLIEMEKFDLASSSIESLRKQLERGNKPVVRMARWTLIKRALLSLSRGSFRFKQFASRNKELLSQLSGTDMKHRWLIMSPEMIPFEDWVIAKAAGEQYDHLKVMQHQADLQHELNRMEELELEQGKLEHAEYS